MQESAPIRGFQLPKSLSIACNAVGSTLCSRSCPAKKRTRERRAGSIPIKWYAAFDHWARALPPGPLRIWVRSVLIAWLSYRLRLVDVLRTAGRLYVCE